MPIAFPLVQTGCPADQTNNAGETALAFAALFARVDIIPFLIEHGANPNHRDTQGQTALAVAEKQGNEAVMAALRAAGAGPTARLGGNLLSMNSKHRS